MSLTRNSRVSRSRTWTVAATAQIRRSSSIIYDHGRTLQDRVLQMNWRKPSRVRPNKSLQLTAGERPGRPSGPLAGRGIAAPWAAPSCAPSPLGRTTRARWSFIEGDVGMIDHTGIGVADVARSAAFYDA